METITVYQDGKRFVARCTYQQKDIVKMAGFRWDRDNRHWYTTEPAVAAKFASPEAQRGLFEAQERERTRRAQNVEASRLADADIDIPCPEGLAYLPYQKAGIAAALKRPSVLFGDEPGLGKTIETIGIINCDNTLRRILVICPASLKLNWKRELTRWLVEQREIQIAQGGYCHVGREGILIINYDIILRNQDKLKSIKWDAVIIDEMHFLKNPKAKRTLAIVGGKLKWTTTDGLKIEKHEQVFTPIQGRRRIGLTGTPIPNRPIEGWPIFNYLDPMEFSNRWRYAERYCGASDTGFGWNDNGHSNLAELQTRLRSSIMIRRLKADVLTELPAKRRAVIEFQADELSDQIQAERDAWERKEAAMLEMRVAVELAKASENPEVYKEAVANLKAAASVAFQEISKVRHQTAVAKIPYVVEHVRSAIESGGKVILFAHHRDVIQGIANEFAKECVTLFGETEMARRQANVDRFQNDPTCTLFIGGILAAGVGITLTASSHVIFAELDWVPGNVTQAEDRAHRIGQRNMVLVEHLVLEGSLDARMAEILVDKQGVIEAALDKESDGEPVIPVGQRERGATESATKKAIEKEAAKLTTAEIQDIHRKLQILAGMDQDHASQLNGMGFSRIDGEIGHSLARCGGLTAKQAALGAKLCNKYRKQLGGI